MSANAQSFPDLGALRALSARVGADPALVQGAGGNTSVKQDGILWIKASGTWLSEAMDRDIMVAVEIEPLLKAVAASDPAAEKAEQFVVPGLGPQDLRPSIETTVHALMPQRVVVHVHCVETIALAVREDGEARCGALLGGLNWAFVPYRRPGLPLARAIHERLRPGTDVLVLGNHGLVVAADTVEAAEALMRRVSALLAQPARTAPASDTEALVALAGSSYALPKLPQSHAVATDPASCHVAAGGSLYPDHVIFLGVGSVLARPGENAEQVAARETLSGNPAPVSILFPGKGVLMRRGASAGAEAMARCIADVAARIPDDARLRYFTPQENGELLNWDAEKYRQQLAMQQAAQQQ